MIRDTADVYYLSPLRYPGGKAELAPYIGRVAAVQYPRIRDYAEPFAGGAGAALRLLADEMIHNIHINDLNPGIAAMWRAIVVTADRFAARIEQQTASVTEWEHARDIYLRPDEHDDFELGFATFLLNRWNRSGILTARPIGGLEQTGNWKIDARFNRQDLADRVRFIGDYRSRINVTELDARDFLRALESSHATTLVYVDPPYLTQGESLYYDSLTGADHEELAQQLRGTHLRWLLTYDVDPRITSKLYPGLRCARFRISHTAQRQHVGSEYVVFSPTLVVPDLELLRRADADWVTASSGA